VIGGKAESDEEGFDKRISDFIRLAEITRGAAGGDLHARAEGEEEGGTERRRGAEGGARGGG